MKRYIVWAGVWLACSGVLVQAQTGGSGAGNQGATTPGNAGSGNASGAQTSTSSGGSGASSSSAGQSTISSSTGGGTAASSSGAQSGTLPPGLEKKEVLPPGLQKGLPPGLEYRTNGVAETSAATNQASGLVPTNQIATTTQSAGTNQLATGTNQVAAATNNSALTPTGRAYGTNQVYGTNTGAFSGTNVQHSGRNQDQAFTEQDRTVLVTLRQQVAPQLRLPSGAWMPVHFTVQEGVVTIIGIVDRIEIKQQIEAVASRCPGVVRVSDQLRVGPFSSGVGGGESDVALLRRVRETVLPQIQVPSVSVDFGVQDGVVIVTGIAPSMQQKQRVATLVREVPGVVDVSDQVRVNTTLVPSGF